MDVDSCKHYRWTVIPIILFPNLHEVCLKEAYTALKTINLWWWNLCLTKAHLQSSNALGKMCGECPNRTPSPYTPSPATLTMEIINVVMQQAEVRQLDLFVSVV